MKRKLIGSTLGLLTGAALLSGCGSDSTPAASVMPAQPQTLDTAQVLAMAHEPSETADPLPVVDGAVTIADANDETSDPAPVS